jgi:cytochrome c biogenesis protein CcmG/thiol:disulfide interchange protein DsbE
VRARTEPAAPAPPRAPGRSGPGDREQGAVDAGGGGPLRGARRASALVLPTVLATVGALAIVAALLALAAARSGPSAPPPALVVGGRTSVPATRLALLGADGREASLRRFLGRPVVVAFFASWCPACQQDLRVLAAAQRRGEEGGVHVVGVDVHDTEGAAIAALRRARAAMPVLFDPGGRLAVAYGLVGLPATVFLDAGGGELGRVTGPLSATELASWLHRLGASPPRPTP